MSQINGVTFETKVYERDWEFLLNHGILEFMISRCHYTFQKRVLWINNVNNPTLVARYADLMVSNSILDEWHFVDDFAKSAMESFGVNRESLGKGYYYSIAELVGVHQCTTKYLLHFSSDAIMNEPSSNWIDSGIALLEQQKNTLVVNPQWDRNSAHAKEEAEYEDEEFYFGYGFSDQCYLVDIERFKNINMNECNIASERYPKYGGELFEKRVDSFMRNHQLIRATSKNASYKHSNYPKGKLHSRIFRLLLPLSGRNVSHAIFLSECLPKLKGAVKRWIFLLAEFLLSPFLKRNA